MIEINLFWILALVVLIVIVFVLLIGFKNLLDNKKDIHFKDKDTEIAKELTNVSVKFAEIGQVSSSATKDLIILNNQNVENNQELLVHDKKLENFAKELVELKSKISGQNVNMNKLVAMLDKLDDKVKKHE